MTDKYTIYGDSRSGNCYKLELVCNELDIPYDWQEVDILPGSARAAVAINVASMGKQFVCLGRIPERHVTGTVVPLDPAVRGTHGNFVGPVIPEVRHDKL